MFRDRERQDIFGQFCKKKKICNQIVTKLCYNINYYTNQGRMNMAKQWNIVVDERPYLIELKSGKVLINNEANKLKTYPQKRTWIMTEVHLKIGSKDALLVISSFFGGIKLIVDGKDCSTGEQYIPVKLPKWAYVFIVLQFVNMINGALGALIAVAGVSATIAISSNPKMNTAVKIFLDILLLLAAAVAVFALAMAVYSVQ